MSATPFRSLRRRIALLTALPVLTSAVWLLAAGPTVACSCVAAGPMATYATTDFAVFSGTAGPKDARGVPVRVVTWYSGDGASPMVYLSATSFGDSAACGTNAPPPGTSWIWVASLPEGETDLITGLCNPQAQLGTPEGDAMVADASKTFGGVVLADPSAPPEAAPSPPVPADMAPAILAGTIGLGLVLFLGVALLARRSRRAV